MSQDRGTAHGYCVEVPGLAEPLKVETAGDGAPPLAVGDAVDVGWGAEAARLLRRERA